MSLEAAGRFPAVSAAHVGWAFPELDRALPGEKLLDLLSPVVPARRQSFSVRTELDSSAVWERIKEHPDVRESDEPSPSPAPPQGARFLAARVDGEILVRIWAGPADAASPIVHIDLVEDVRGCLVRGRVELPRRTRSFRRLPPKVPWQAYVPPSIGLALALATAWSILGTGIWALFVLILLAAIPAGLVIVPGLIWWEAESRREQSAALWALLGEVFAPLALPLGAEPHPFREKGSTLMLAPASHSEKV